MDDSWLFNNEETEEQDSASDDEEKRAELEERLYSIVHHNDLSQPLPPELAKHYNIQCTDSGELEVSLKNTLEDIQTEENETIHNRLNSADTNSRKVVESNVTGAGSASSNDDVIIIPHDEIVKESRSFLKGFRYSDVNIESAFSSEEGKKQPTSNDINYFKFFPGIYKKRNKRFSDLKIPSSFSPSDWKTDANASFISIGSDQSSEREEIIQKMTQALLKLNPSEKPQKLSAFARVLYHRNVPITVLSKNKRKKANRKLSKQLAGHSSNLDSSRFCLSQDMSNCNQNISEEIYKSSFLKGCEKFSTPKNSTNKCKSKVRENGSISLNISPFRPSPQVVNLVSDEEKTTLSESTFKTPKQSKIIHHNDQKTLSRRHLPCTWTKEMKKYYTKPMKKEYDTDIATLIQRLKRTSTAKDWHLDPRDQLGIYDRKLSPKMKNRRCTNCRDRGHTIHNCPSPIKELSCALCGQLYHSDYTCPNKVCMKCGVFTSNNAYEGECNSCYYSTLEGDIPCTICGELTHQSANCPDLWRSFHATTSGEKRVPEETNVNKRKYCCNCARKGHFSHECPFVLYSGQQISPFVKNYSAESSVKGRVDFYISKNDSNFNSREGDNFLQHLSNNTEATITCDEDYFQYSFNVEGTFEQCSMVKKEIESFVNVRKRKRHEPMPTRKRQRVRF